MYIFSNISSYHHVSNSYSSTGSPEITLTIPQRLIIIQRFVQSKDTEYYYNSTGLTQGLNKTLELVVALIFLVLQLRYIRKSYTGKNPLFALTPS